MKKYLIMCLAVLGIVALLPTDLSAQDEGMDQKFVDMATSSNRFEVAIGAQAAQKSSSTAVKEFANMLVKDHTKALEELEGLARAKGIPLPEQLEENKASILKSMADLSGPDYDNSFKEIMIKTHEEAITLFELAAKDDGVKDTELRAWAQGKLPALKKHLEHAKSLQTGRVVKTPPMPVVTRDSVKH